MVTRNQIHDIYTRRVSHFEHNSEGGGTVSEWSNSTGSSQFIMTNFDIKIMASMLVDIAEMACITITRFRKSAIKKLTSYICISAKILISTDISKVLTKNY